MARCARALVAQSAGSSLKFQDILLDSLRPDEALVEIHAVGICHADISCLSGKLPVGFPIVLGHEGSGIIKETGSAVDNITPGDAVILSFNSCGQCRNCERSIPAYCANMLPLNFGGTRLDKSHTLKSTDGQPIYGNYFGQSSFSSLAVVNRRCLVKVPSKSPLDLYAPLGCGFQTGAGAILNTLEMQPGSSVAVFGTGAVGMAAIMTAKIRKASIIIGIDVDMGRLRVAKELGATYCLNGSDPNIADQIRKICSGDGVDYAVDCTGVAAAIECMIDSLGTLGKAATIGAPSPGTQVSIDVFSHLTKGRKYMGCNQGDSVPQTMIPWLIEQYAEGAFPLEKLIRFYAVEDFQAALDDMKSGKVIKPVLVWKT